MNTYIALFRGINVGGNNILPMKELKALLEGLGMQNVRTYIQSGNVVFQSEGQSTSQLTDDISMEIEKNHGFKPQVILLRITDLKKAIAANPFPEAEADPRRLHLFFLTSIPKKPALQELEDMKKATERFAITGKVFYLHAPKGIGRSKLAANVERCLGVPITARNWRTVCKIMDMVES